MCALPLSHRFTLCHSLLTCNSCRWAKPMTTRICGKALPCTYPVQRRKRYYSRRCPSTLYMLVFFFCALVLSFVSDPFFLCFCCYCDVDRRAKNTRAFASFGAPMRTCKVLLRPRLRCSPPPPVRSVVSFVRLFLFLLCAFHPLLFSQLTVCVCVWVCVCSARLQL
jgi:hypothetical protein